MMRQLRIATTAFSAFLVFQTCPIASASSKDKSNKSEHKNELAPEISLDELKNLINSKTATIIDANAESTFDKGRIPTSVSYIKNKTNFAAILPADKNALLVAYCGGPMCKAWEEPAKFAKSMGYTNIKHFKGGLKVWKDSGNELAK
jgi:rhodanese-related sulfurtransferase